jgi:hypothetical protein
VLTFKHNAPGTFSCDTCDCPDSDHCAVTEVLADDSTYLGQVTYVSACHYRATTDKGRTRLFPSRDLASQWLSAPRRLISVDTPQDIAARIRLNLAKLNR